MVLKVVSCFDHEAARRGIGVSPYGRPAATTAARPGPLPAPALAPPRAKDDAREAGAVEEVVHGLAVQVM